MFLYRLFDIENRISYIFILEVIWDQQDSRWNHS